VKYLEHVHATLNIEHPRRGDVRIELTAPSGKSLIHYIYIMLDFINDLMRDFTNERILIVQKGAFNYP
jgi:Regulatory P domain of the subtilisin-like proprotein convertases and other proteases